MKILSNLVVNMDFLQERCILFEMLGLYKNALKVSVTLDLGGTTMFH